MDLYSKKRDVLYGIVEADIGESTTISAGGSVQRSRPRGISWGGLPALDASGKPIDWPKGQAMGAKWSRWDTDSHEYFAQIEHGFPMAGTRACRTPGWRTPSMRRCCSPRTCR